jgi:hypothetical protein
MRTLGTVCLFAGMFCLLVNLLSSHQIPARHDPDLLRELAAFILKDEGAHSHSQPAQVIALDQQ